MFYVFILTTMFFYSYEKNYSTWTTTQCKLHAPMFNLSQHC